MEIPSFRLVDGTSALASSSPFEAELAKDRWDARNIPGLRYAQHTGSYYIRFTTAPDRFRPLLKAYAKFQIASGRTAGTISQQILHLGHFFTFFVQRYPNTFALHDLTKQDIDAFIVHLKATMDARGKPTSETQVGRHVERLEGLLSYLERSQNPMRPEKPTACLIWPHHHPA